MNCAAGATNNMDIGHCAVRQRKQSVRTHLCNVFRKLSVKKPANPGGQLGGMSTRVTR